MDCTIYYNSVDITEQVIEYTRSQAICTGIGSANVIIKSNSTTVFTPYSIFEIYEDGIKKGKYYIVSIEKSIPESKIILVGQDESKKLSDYFISDSYTIESPTYTRYWIEKFLTEATITYTFDVAGNGELLSNNSYLGLSPASDIITQLVQQSGWYFYADSNNTIHIGNITSDLNSPVAIIYDTSILNIDLLQSDKTLRNRAVVWGSGNSGQWIFADQEINTPYNYDDLDYRTAVLSNYNITDKSSANRLATRLLKEMEKISYIKTITIAGYINAKIGDVIAIESKYFSGLALITSIQSKTNLSGATTTLVLDEKCPRLFGFYDYGGRVYVGTNGMGVWRKPLKYLHTWENFSTGLTNLDIKDLSVCAGVHACVSTSGELFIRYPADTQWTKFVPSGFYDPSFDIMYPTISGFCMSCTVDRITNHIQAVYNIGNPFYTLDNGLILVSGGSFRSWLVDLTNKTNYTTFPIMTSGNIYDYYAYDLDNNEETTYVQVRGATGTEQYFIFDTDIYPDQDIEHSLHNITSLLKRTGGSDKTIGNQTYSFYTNDRNTVFDVRKQNIRTGIYTEVTSIPKATSAGLHLVGRDENIAFVCYGTIGDNFRVDKIDFQALTYTNIDTINLPSSGTYIWKADGKTTTNTSLSFHLGLDSVGNKIIFVQLVGTRYETVGGKTFQYTRIGYITWDASLPTPFSVEYVSEDFEHLIYVGEDIYFKDPLETNLITYEGNIYFFHNYKYYHQPFGGVQHWENDLLRLTRFNLSTHVSTTQEWILNNDFTFLDFVPDYRSLNASTIFGVTFHKYLDTVNRYTEVWSINTITLTRTILYTLSGVSTTGIPFSKDFYYRVTSSNPNDVYNLITNQYLFTLPFYADTYYFSSYSIIKTNYRMASRADDEDNSLYSTKYISPIYSIVKISSTGVETILYSSLSSIGTRLKLAGSKLIDSNNAIYYREEETYLKAAIQNGLLKKSLDAFTVVGSTYSPDRVETSKNAPILAFGGNSITNMGEAFASARGDPNTLYYINFANTSGYISDLRTCDILTESGNCRLVMTLSPQISGSLFRMFIPSTNLVTDNIISVTSVSGIYTLSGFYLIAQNINHLETTNYQDLPYVFLSLSGIPTIFYQKDGRNYNDLETYFVNRTTNLPTTHQITIIRADDWI